VPGATSNYLLNVDFFAIKKARYLKYPKVNPKNTPQTTSNKNPTKRKYTTCILVHYMNFKTQKIIFTFPFD